MADVLQNRSKHPHCWSSRRLQKQRQQQQQQKQHHISEPWVHSHSQHQHQQPAASVASSPQSSHIHHHHHHRQHHRNSSVRRINITNAATCLTLFLTFLLLQFINCSALSVFSPNSLSASHRQHQLTSNRHLRSSGGGGGGDPHFLGQDAKEYFGTIMPTQSLHPAEERMRCVYYNQSECILSKGKIGCGTDNQFCNDEDSPHLAKLCYTLWKYKANGSIEITYKGCWLGQANDCTALADNKSEKCIQPKNTPHPMHFCCCVGPNCNARISLNSTDIFEYDKNTDPSPEPKNEGHSDPTTSSISFLAIFMFIMLLISLIVLVLILGTKGLLKGFRRKKSSNRSDAPTSEPLLEENGAYGSAPKGYCGHGPITLGEVRAQGKFGWVFKALDASDNVVAVKMFNSHDLASWETERHVFCLPQMKHPNILNYLGAEQHGEGIDMKYWLITEYHPLGSLYDYLKSHTITLKQFLTIFVGISRGLSHLHSACPATDTEPEKPSIAHRDFKSKNVLLNSNLRPCIADFGLAIIFKANKLSGDAHGQVGTRRYMAPEVLEGSISFSWEAFNKIDMYACGLVLWELLSRTHFQDIKASEYQMPFEKEVGTYPSLEEMQEMVCEKKKRPEIRPELENHPMLIDIIKTIRDCWDQEPEARVAASTIVERAIEIVPALGDEYASVIAEDSGEYPEPLTTVQIQPNPPNSRVSYVPNMQGGLATSAAYHQNGGMSIVAPNNVLSNARNGGPNAFLLNHNAMDKV